MRYLLEWRYWQIRQAPCWQPMSGFLVLGVVLFAAARSCWPTVWLAGWPVRPCRRLRRRDRPSADADGRSFGVAESRHIWLY